MEYPQYVKKYKTSKQCDYICYLCSRTIEYDSVGIEYHLKSNNHKKRMEEFFCKTCNIQCKCLSAFERHLNTKHHKNGGVSLMKIVRKCESCNTTFDSKIDQDRHNLTKKHIKNTS